MVVDAPGCAIRGLWRAPPIHSSGPEPRLCCMCVVDKALAAPLRALPSDAAPQSSGLALLEVGSTDFQMDFVSLGPLQLQVNPIPSWYLLAICPATCYGLTNAEKRLSTGAWLCVFCVCGQSVLNWSSWLQCCAGLGLLDRAFPQ
jgi:hypothetical protein